MMSITDGAWAGTIGATATDVVGLGDPHLATYVAAMRRYSPDEASPWFYLAGMAFAELAGEGLRRSGRDLTRESFLDAIAALGDWRGTLTPPSHFSADQHLGTRSVLLYRVRDGGSDRLTSWLQPTLDLDAAIQRLHGGG
jgi:hypothetical protein